MSIQTALRQSWLITSAVLLAGAWIVYQWLHIYETAAASWVVGNYVGQTTVTGIVGLLVMLGLVAFVALLYSNLGEPEPAPDQFPPEQ